MNFDWKTMLSSIAPALGTAIGGPFGGMAAQAALNALGITPEKGKEETQLQHALADATPEDLRKLKAQDQQFTKDMKSLDVDMARLDGKDRDSARALAEKSNAIPQVILSVVYTCAYAVTIYLFMTGQVHVQDGQQVLFGSLLGFLTTAQAQVLNFWFGSSHGSKQKTAIMGSSNG